MSAYYILLENVFKQQVIRSVEKMIVEACEKAAIDHADSLSGLDTPVPLTPERNDACTINPSFSHDEEQSRSRRHRYGNSPPDYGTNTTLQVDISGDYISHSSRARAYSDLVGMPKSQSMVGRLGRAGLLPASAEGPEEDGLFRNPSNAIAAADNDHSRFPEFVVLDCSFVTGFDANASAGLFKLRNRLANQDLGDAVPLPIFLFFAG